MSGAIDLDSYNYGHGIVSQDCLVKEYSDAGIEVKYLWGGTLVQVHAIRDDDVLFCIFRDDTKVDTKQMVCKKADIINVPENLLGPLFCLNKNARLSVVKDSKVAESIGNISVGHTVQVLDSDESVLCTANVVFRNSIEGLPVGVYFGLRILAPREKVKKIAQKISLLGPLDSRFPRDCDILVTVCSILPSNYTLTKDKPFCDEKPVEKSFCSGEDISDGSYKSVINYNLKEKHSKKDESCGGRSDAEVNHSRVNKMINSDNPLKVGDEVIYLRGEVPEKGVVQWIGLIGDNSPVVEVKFDDPIGSGTDGLDEFKGKHQPSFFIPPMALIKLSDYPTNISKEKFQTTSTANNNNLNKINNNNNNNKSNNNSSSSSNNNNNHSNSNNNKNNTNSSQKCTNYYPKTNISVKNNNNNNVNNNEDCCRSSYEFCYDGKQNIEDGYKKSKKMSHQCLKHADCFPNEEEVFGGKDSYKGSEQERSHRGHICTRRKHSSSNEEDFSLHETLSAHSGEKNWRTFYEKDAWNRPEQSDLDETLANYRFSSDDLGKGSVVELTHRGEPHYGVIRWIGTLQEDREAGSPRLTAGIEMEEESSDFTDGTYNSRRYFRCNPKKALFVPLSRCRKDSRFSDESQKISSSPRINYGQMDCPLVEGTIPPINRKGDIESICGKNRGIQGHHNSCYLDATLFSMFAFTSVFDSLLYRPPTKNDIPQYTEVQRVLREEIVNPLRKNLYVRADRVMKLRTLLEKLSSVSGLTSEEKDPEEFLNSLLAQILKAEPFLKLSSGQEAFHYQLFVEKDERLVLPSVQQLFEQSFLTSDIKLKQVPSCLIIQMPRFGKSFKMYSKILPPQLLDITDIIENSPRQCTVCGKLAEYECKDCFGQQGIGNGLESISFCKTCSETVHNHHCRNRHDSRALTVPEEFYELQEHCVIPRLYMELFAVVCIETSHYVAFVKCGSGSDAPWCFFDSMADRKGEQNGYNIPEMVPCPDLPYWLSEDGAKMLNEMRDERQLTEHAKRLFSDAYMCMYQSPDMMMYR